MGDDGNRSNQSPTLTQEGIENRWMELDDRERSTKIANLAAVEFAKTYRALSGQDRDVFERTLARWLLSAESRRQFTALAVISSCSIASALPTLRELQSDLEASGKVSAVHDWQHVNQIIGRLS
jgi:hypothetical protein